MFVIVGGVKNSRKSSSLRENLLRTANYSASSGAGFASILLVVVWKIFRFHIGNVLFGGVADDIEQLKIAP